MTAAADEPRTPRGRPMTPATPRTPPPDDPATALALWPTSSTDDDDGWGSPVEIATAIARGQTTARLSRRHRWALLAVLGVLARKQDKGQRQREELDAAHADRKRLRGELEELRQDRDRWRKQAESTRGRPGCGKIPIGSTAQAWQFVELVCAKSGERPDEYEVYPCRRGCEIIGSMTAAWHIGHVVSRAERERAAAERAAPMATTLGGEAADRLAAIAATLAPAG